jgi:glutaminyl-tRNA synthetase
LFNVEDPAGTEEDFRTHINPSSLVLKAGFVEPSVQDHDSNTRYQFERLGFFWRDPVASKPGALVFNRIVSLKDSWTKIVETQSAGRSEVQMLHQERRRQREEQKARQAATFKQPTSELNAVASRYHEELQVPRQQAQVLGATPALARFFDEAYAESNLALNPTSLANWIVTEVARETKGAATDALKLTPRALGQLVSLVDSGKITARAGKDVFAELAKHGGEPATIVDRLGLGQLASSNALLPLIDAVLTEFASKVQDYKAGNTNLLGLFIGQVMKRAQGKADPKLLSDLIKTRLDA